MEVISLLTVAGNYVSKTINELSNGNEVNFWVNTCHNKKLINIQQGDYAAIFLGKNQLMYVGEVFPAKTIDKTANTVKPIITTSIQNTFDAYKKIPQLGSLGLDNNATINDFTKLINDVFSSKTNLNPGDKITSIIIKPIKGLIGQYNPKTPNIITTIGNLNNNNNLTVTLPSGKTLNIPKPDSGSKSVIVI